MKHGFVRVAAATPRIRVADTRFNTDSILSCIKQAKEEGAELLVFPELCICGYTCGDLFGQDVLLRGASEALREIAAATEGAGMLVFVGVPLKVNGVLYNCAAALNSGKVLAFIPKRHLPNYAEFYEKRNFQPYAGENIRIPFGGAEIPFGRKFVFRCREESDFTVAAELCEDLWVPRSALRVACTGGGKHHCQPVRQRRNGGQGGISPPARARTVGQNGIRLRLCGCRRRRIDHRYGFFRHDLICENGEILAESALFANGITCSEIDVRRLAFERRRMNTFYDGSDLCGYEIISFSAGGAWESLSRPVSRLPFVPSSGRALDNRAELILSMQAAGLRKRLEHTRAATAVLGISGGLDSALALLVCVRAFDALGKDRKGILAVTMPCFGTTDRTFQNSLHLMRALGVTSRTIPIADAVRGHFKDIGHDENVRNAAYENAQARMRTLVLMDLANDTDGLVVGTGDLSELALGWATYNGDHMSMYGVNASVPKTLVKYLIRYEAMRLGGEAQAVLEDVLDTEISPELLPPEGGEDRPKNGRVGRPVRAA